MKNAASLPFLKKNICYLVHCGQLLAVGGEGHQASGQVDQAADLQVRIGAAGGRRAGGVPRAHHVAVAPLDAAGKDTASNLDWE